MDLYSIYEKLFPDISEEELYKLPSPTSILRDEWCPFPIIYLDKDGPIHTVVIRAPGVQDTLIRIRDGYHSEYGYDYNPEVAIVEAVERKVIEYIEPLRES